MIRNQLTIIYTALFLCTAVDVCAQDSVAKNMVRLDKYIPGIEVDLRYAGTSNFMKLQLYPSHAHAWLQKEAADSLRKVVEELRSLGLTLKIFDSYRPWSVTNMMWEKVKDERYAADPKKGSNHNRGIAVDLTLVSMKNNKELDMGTGFDNFTDSAHHDFNNLPADVIYRRSILKTTMQKHGFKALDTEWWHYSLSNGKNYPILNIGLDELEKQNN